LVQIRLPQPPIVNSQTPLFPRRSRRQNRGVRFCVAFLAALDKMWATSTWHRSSVAAYETGPRTCCQRLIGDSSGTSRPSQPGKKAATQHPSRVTKPTHRPIGWQTLFRCPPDRQQFSIRHGCVWLASCRCSLRWHFAAELCVAILPATIGSRCEPRQNILS
jgi:hypothetical protein